MLVADSQKAIPTTYSFNNKGDNMTEKNGTHEAVNEHAETPDEVKEGVNLPESFTKVAENARQGIIERLREAADRIRGEIDSAEDLDDKARNEAAKVVTRLDKVGDYLENHDVHEIEADAREFAEETVRQHTWQLLLVMFVIGFVVGIILKRGGDD
jgi:ElaB/YqjD/DUF883 family membrane-anchored ribosome-binding protein